MKPIPLEWLVALVRPRNPLNIGAAARAMANFGLSDLAVVKAYAPVWQETRSAVGAGEVIRRARAFDELRPAIGEAGIVIGTTSGARRNLDRPLVPLDELANWLGLQRPRFASPGTAAARTSRVPRRAALLFGSEKTGLSTEELSYCHVLVRIPTSVGCPSMNLGQAVAVCCYELARSGLFAVRRPAARLHLSEAANVESLEHIFDRAVRLLDLAGHLKPKSRAATLIKLRRLLYDLGLTNSQARILGGVIAQVEWRLGNR